MSNLRKKHRNQSYGIPSLFNDFLFNNFEMPASISKTIKVNITEEEDKFNLELVVPGYEKEDFSIELENDMLTVSAEKEEEKTEEDEKRSFIRKEYSAMSFSRSFNLPETIDIEKIEADYNNGVMKINLPKLEKVINNKVKSISIK